MLGSHRWLKTTRETVQRQRVSGKETLGGEAGTAPDPILGRNGCDKEHFGTPCDSMT